MIEPTQEEQNLVKQFLQDEYSEKMPILMQYIEMVLFANQKYNLIGKSTEQNIWTRHIIDSLQLLPYIKNAENIVDFGSGAGFPALVLAICAEKNMILFEKSPVKANFLKNVIKTLKLNAFVENKILTEQSCLDIIQKPCVITSRAFKSVAEILFLVNDNRNIHEILLLKGQKWQEEISHTPSVLMKNWAYEVKNSILGDGVVIKFIRKNAPCLR